MNPLREALPQVAALLGHLTDEIDREHITTRDEFVADCRRRWDDATLAATDAVIPHWRKMASYADGQTLWHVTAAMLALRELDEYREASPKDQKTLDWTVMLHDIAKEPTHERRDHRHAFRSAAVALRTLPRLGAATTAAFDLEVDAYHEMVLSAHRHSEAAGEDIQDNRFLPGMLAGASRLLEPEGACVVTAIALHSSITVLEAWPARAPISPDEERELVTPAVAALLLPLMLADSGGWNLFDPATLDAMYAETRQVFAGMAARWN